MGALNRSLGQRGFTFIELAISLVVIGVVGLAVWQLIPATQDVAEGDPAERMLANARISLEGYVLQHHRLPCPDATGDGLEDCSSAGSGHLPWQTLGLSPDSGVLRYGVHRSGIHDLTLALPRFAPDLPPGHGSNVINGLDFCAGVRDAANASTGFQVGGMRAAYALAHPGPNGQFEAGNVAGFELPGTHPGGGYDDLVYASGLHELFARLDCHSRLAAVGVKGRAAYAAYDLNRNMELFRDYRSFAYEVRRSNLEFAIANLVLASLDMLNAIGTSVSAISVAANSAGVGAGVIAGAVAAIGAAAASLVAASVQVALAEIARDKAERQKESAMALYLQSLMEAQRAIQAAIDSDNRGLVQ